jgi:hypothetical protein
MGFASVYLGERTLFPQLIKEAPDRNTGIIVVIPAYNETGIIKLLDSLSGCREPQCKTEVIIVINAPENATPESLENNRLTFSYIESWKKENICFFRLFPVIVPALRGWGVGMARKTGMDEAIRRFNSIDKADGVILNLDADCTVGQNYFKAISSELLLKNEYSACSIYFEHPVSGNLFHENIYRYITLYELHLRYFYQGIIYSGFPYAFHTVGSAVAVKALPYVKAGGMNRKQAGEDFYFIQKLIPAGGYFALNSTTVFPSPRPSSRVPFGTGASIEKLYAGNNNLLLTYNTRAFDELKAFFNMTEVLFSSDPKEFPTLYANLPDGMRSFFEENDLEEKLMEIRNNTSGLQSFRKRFFGWFNMFKIVKYLNFVHSDLFEKKPVEVSAADLLNKIGEHPGITDPLSLLMYYRKLEKNS